MAMSVGPSEGYHIEILTLADFAGHCWSETDLVDFGLTFLTLDWPCWPWIDLADLGLTLLTLDWPCWPWTDLADIYMLIPVLYTFYCIVLCRVGRSIITSKPWASLRAVSSSWPSTVSVHSLNHTSSTITFLHHYFITSFCHYIFHHYIIISKYNLGRVQ